MLGASNLTMLRDNPVTNLELLFMKKSHAVGTKNLEAKLEITVLVVTEFCRAMFSVTKVKPILSL